MADLKRYTCKVCGADLGDKIVSASENVIRCSYCNSTWTLARKEVDDKALTLITLGEQDLSLCKFTEAYEDYKKAIELDKNEPEAYFGLALARFKIQFLKDEVNNRLQPVCHEYTEKRFSEDLDYKKALGLAAPRQSFEYEKKANEIDKVLLEFMNLSNAKVNYDTFICVKVSGENGQKTKDCERAFETYYYLREKGYSPFFSEVTLKDKTGSDYEAHILYALSVSKSMLVFCENEEYLETKWIKNEYTRFLEMIADEKKKENAIAIVFYQKPVERLPGRKGKLQGIDYSKPTASEQIKNFVDGNCNVLNQVSLNNIKSEDAKRIIIQLQDQVERLRKQKNEAVEPSTEEALKGCRIEKNANGITIRRFANESKIFVPECVSLIENFAIPQMIEEFVVSKDNKFYKSVNGVVFSKDGKKLCFYPPKRQDKEYAIPYGTEIIGEDSFSLAQLLQVLVPETVTTIENRAFQFSKLKSLLLPEGVKTIGEEAFDRCEDMSYVKIPTTVTYVGPKAFSGCAELTIYLPGGKPLFGTPNGWDKNFCYSTGQYDKKTVLKFK